MLQKKSKVSENIPHSPLHPLMALLPLSSNEIEWINIFEFDDCWLSRLLFKECELHVKANVLYVHNKPFFYNSMIT